MPPSTTCPVVIGTEVCTSGQRIVKRLCLFHYKQVAAGRPVTVWHPRRSPGSALTRDEDGRKECTRCGQWLPTDDFGPSSSTIDGLQAWCTTCSADYMSLNRYGLTRADVAARVAEQGGCAICKRQEPGGSDYRSGWHVDHDHACCPGERSCGKCIRSILCARCNKILGLAIDDPNVLRAAADYLTQADCERRHAKETQ